MDAFLKLMEVVARLRAKDGCPWDKAQTLETLRPYLIEETYEVIEALERGEAMAHRDELGDLLLQIAMQSQIRSEEGAFGLSDVAEAAASKMIRRHPHLFGSEAQAPETNETADAQTLDRLWGRIKAKESGRKSALDGIPHAMPALLLARRLGEKASGAGFDWRELSGVLQKLDEERDELCEAIDQGDPEAIDHELGDLLFSVVNVSRHLKIDPEASLRRASARFEARFRHLEAGILAEGLRVEDLSDDALDERWHAAKRALKDGSSEG